jgi:hypothetical protein
MSGTLGIIANDAARYTLFSVCLTQLKHPPNTRVDWALCTDMTRGRNMLVERSLEMGSEWMLFIDDDHVYPSDLLLRLLSHDKPIVGSLYLRRHRPFAPNAFSHLNEDLSYQPIDLTSLPNDGLLKVKAVGTSGLLIRSEVFREIPKPWFEYGQIGEWGASEDIIFCEKAGKAGIDVHVDLSAQLGHLAPCAVWPSWVDQEWTVGFSVADGLRLYCPIEKEAEAQEAAADAVRR